MSVTAKQLEELATWCRKYLGAVEAAARAVAEQRRIAESLLQARDEFRAAALRMEQFRHDTTEIVEQVAEFDRRANEIAKQAAEAVRIPAAVAEGTRRLLSQREALITALHEMAQVNREAARTHELIDWVSRWEMDIPHTSASSILAKSVKRGEIKKLARGTWALPDSAFGNIRLMPCELCDQDSRKRHHVDDKGIKDAWFVDCSHCGQFSITGVAANVLAQIENREAVQEKLRLWTRDTNGETRITTDVLSSLSDQQIHTP